MPVSNAPFFSKYLTKSFSSIQTYNRRGVGKPGVPKNEHAIIYTSASAPNPLQTELPQSRYEEGMLSSIRVNANNNDVLDTMSRINFGKIYTVEHNVKVFDFGQVDNNFRLILHRQFWDVLRNKEQRTARAIGTSQTIHEVDEGREGEDDDESDESDSDSEE